MFNLFSFILPGGRRLPFRRSLAALGLLLTTAGVTRAQTFATAATYGTGTVPQGIAAVDVNGDGRRDLITANSNSNNVGVLLGSATTPGTFPATATFYNSGGTFPVGLGVGDVNGDGRPDIVVANSNSSTVGVLLNSAITPGTFLAAVTYGSGNTSPRGLSLADVNGDGKLDIVTGGVSSTSGVGVLLNSAATPGVFGTAANYSTGVNSDGIAMGDANADGRPDIVVTGYTTANTVVVLLNSATAPGTFPTTTSYGSGGSMPRGVTLGDVNGDNLADLVVGNQGGSTVVVLLNQLATPGAFGPAVAYQTGSTGANGVRIQDMDGDGRPDIITANYAGGTGSTISVLRNVAAAPGTFTAGTAYASGGSGPINLALSDLNNDGMADIAATLVGSSAVGVLLNTTVTAAPTLTQLTPSSGPVGTSVTLTGTGLSGTTGVSFNGTAASTFAVVDANTVTATVPAGATTGNVTVTTSGGSSNGVAFTVTTAPTVTTAAATSVTSTSAVLGGNVTADGGASVSGRGVVYSSTNTSPAIGGTGVTQAANGSGTGSFSATISGLSASTTYYVQAYATNSASTSYGGVQSFTTNAATVTVTAVTGQTPSPTATAQVVYTVTFSAPVSGVTTSNFSLTTTGLSGAGIASVSPTTGASATYTVVVNTGTGNGTLQLNVANATGSTPSVTNTPYTSGTTYTITKSFAAAPTLRIQGAGSASGNSDVTAFVDVVQVLSGGTAVSNALQNNSFESNNVSPSDYLYAPSVVASPWSFGPQAGVTRNNSAFGSTAADGDAVAFLQSAAGNNGNVLQNLALPTGSYQVRFRAIQRNYTSLDQRLNVFVNDVFVGTIQPNNIPTYDTFTSTPFSVTAPALTATVSTTSGSPTSTSPIPFSVSFSQSVGTTFTASDVTVAGGTLTSGSFSGSGAGPYTFTVTPSALGTVSVSLAAGVATDANNTGNSASNTVSVQFVAPTIVVGPASLPNGQQGTAYSQALSASGGTAPYAYAITAGALPSGLSLNLSNGTIAGTPTANGTFNFTVTATDASTAPGPYSGARSYSLLITAPAITATTWTGTISTDWFTAGNWTQGVPNTTIDATIPTAPSGGRFPAVAAGTANVRNLTFNSGATLNQSGGTLALAANLTNNGTFLPTGGTVSLGSTSLSNVLGSSNIRFWNLTVGVNGAQLSTSIGASVQRLLTLNGSFATNGNSFTLESNTTLTALVVNNDSNVVNGTVTVQRAIDPSVNSGLGYRHYSTPVSNSTVSDLATSGFTPVVNPAYNTDAMPYSVVPFPTMFGYDDSRLTLTNNAQPFDKGFFSPSALSDPLAVGKGYTVNIAASELVDFQGTLNNGDQTLNLTSTRNTYPDGGWQFLGNPYPAPLDYSQVAPADRVGLESAIYVYSSTTQYSGRYRVYINGIGNPVVPLGQGFFTRVASGQAAATITFRNSQRLTAPNGTTLQRTTADPRPLVQLTLQGQGAAPADEAYVYFENGATSGFEPAFDAEKLPNPTGFNLSTTQAGKQLSVDGQSELGTAQRVVPLAVGVPAAGSYTLKAAELLNLSTTPTYLRDLQTGALVDLAQQPSYQFTVSNASALLTNRFELVFSPQQALATATAALAQQVGLYPNPAKASAFVELPASLGRQAVTATLVDALGRVVRTAVLPAQGALAHPLDLHELPSGVYALRLHTSAGLVVKRLTVE